MKTQLKNIALLFFGISLLGLYLYLFAGPTVQVTEKPLQFEVQNTVGETFELDWLIMDGMDTVLWSEGFFIDPAASFSEPGHYSSFTNVSFDLSTVQLNVQLNNSSNGETYDTLEMGLSEVFTHCENDTHYCVCLTIEADPVGYFLGVEEAC